MSRYVISEVTFVIFLSALKEKLKFRFDFVKWSIFIIFDLFFLPLPRVMMGVDGQMLLSEDCVNRRWPKPTVWASSLCWKWEWGYLVLIDWLVDRSIDRKREGGKEHQITCHNGLYIAVCLFCADAGLRVISVIIWFIVVHFKINNRSSFQTYWSS